MKKTKLLAVLALAGTLTLTGCTFWNNNMGVNEIILELGDYQLSVTSIGKTYYHGILQSTYDNTMEFSFDKENTIVFDTVGYTLVTETVQQGE